MVTMPYDAGMARGHTVDELGRTSPDPAWPTDRAAPGDLDLIRRFCNTQNLESGADRIGTVESAVGWLAAEAIDVGPVRHDDVERLHRLRAALRASIARHNPKLSASDPAPDLAALTSDLRFRVEVGEADDVELAVDARDPYELVAGRLLLLVLDAGRSDRWRRFKACRRCRWVFYDSSKNRSGTWCSMQACGGRSKVDAYRRRRHAAR